MFGWQRPARRRLVERRTAASAVVIAFIFADLLVIPVLNIYRKYCGLKTAGFLLATMYAAMIAAALAVEGIFGAARLIPHEHKARLVEATIQWNYTTVLNIIFGALSILLLVRFFRTAGAQMIRMMNRPAHPAQGHYPKGA